MGNHPQTPTGLATPERTSRQAHPRASRERQARFGGEPLPVLTLWDLINQPRRLAAGQRPRDHETRSGDTPGTRGLPSPLDLPPLAGRPHYRVWLARVAGEHLNDQCADSAMPQEHTAHTQLRGWAASQTTHVTRCRSRRSAIPKGACQHTLRA